MAGRSNLTAAAALADLAEIMRVHSEVSQEQLRALQRNDIPPGEYHGLDKFLKRDPPTFQGEYDPEGAYLWIMKIEKILNSITCT